MLVALGVPQTLAAHVDATTLEGAKQGIAQLGPVASQEIIKQLGTNGGGFFNANSAHPFENPNALVQPDRGGGDERRRLRRCVVAFGVVAFARREARALVAAMVILLVGAASIIYVSETRATPALVHAAHVAAAPNMEGKEVPLRRRLHRGLDR